MRNPKGLNFYVSMYQLKHWNAFIFQSSIVSNSLTPILKLYSQSSMLS